MRRECGIFVVRPLEKPGLIRCDHGIQTRADFHRDPEDNHPLHRRVGDVEFVAPAYGERGPVNHFHQSLFGGFISGNVSNIIGVCGKGRGCCGCVSVFQFTAEIFMH